MMTLELSVIVTLELSVIVMTSCSTSHHAESFEAKNESHLPFVHHHEVVNVEKAEFNDECLTARTGKIGIFLTISSLHGMDWKHLYFMHREIELNWYNELGVQKNDVVALYVQNPILCECKPVVKIKPSKNRRGFYRTNVKFPRITFNDTNLSSDCLGYWGAYFMDGKIVATSCLRAQPFWMYENKKYIEDVPLRDLMLPGSHDSGSYHRIIGKTKTLLTRYLLTQEESIFNQLAFGIRYLDIRVAFYPKDPHQYWINHGIFKTKESLLNVIIQVKEFLDATNELVIFDFHDVSVGFKTPYDYVELCAFVLKFFKDYMVPNTYGNSITPGTMWKINRRLLIGFNSNFTGNSPYMWLAVTHKWGDHRTLRNLYAYFDGIFQEYSVKQLTSSMGEMTPSALYIILHLFSDLRTMAEIVNRHVTLWFRDLWWQEATIVATDYVLGNNIVDVSIRVNKLRKMCPHVPYPDRKSKVMKLIAKTMPMRDYGYILNGVKKKHRNFNRIRKPSAHQSSTSA